MTSYDTAANIDRLTAQVHRLQEQLTACEAERDEAHAATRAELERIRAQRDAYHESNDEAHAALAKAEKERDDYRAAHRHRGDEIERLKVALAKAEADNARLRVTAATGQAEREGPMLLATRAERDRLEAALGRAVAALRRITNAAASMEYPPTTKWLIDTARPVLADPDGKAAGEAWRELEAVYEAARKWPQTGLLAAAIAKVDARRGAK